MVWIKEYFNTSYASSSIKDSADISVGSGKCWNGGRIGAPIKNKLRGWGGKCDGVVRKLFVGITYKRKQGAGRKSVFFSYDI